MEKWRPIPGFEGIYEASSHGRIRTAEGKTTTSRKHGIVHWKQRILKQHTVARKSGSGSDARVTLWKDKEPHYFLVSRLVALTWCPGFSKDKTVNHIDGDPANNKADNLEWVSLSENIRKGFEAGLFSSQKAVILTDPQGKNMSFRSMAEASRFLGKGAGYISGILAKGDHFTPDGFLIRF